MHKFINIALVLFASVAVAHCGISPYGGQQSSGPSVQQVNYASLAGLGSSIDQYLNGGSSASSSSSSASNNGYQQQAQSGDSYAPAKYVVLPGNQQSSYGGQAASVQQQYGAGPSQGYGAAPSSSSYGAQAPRFSSQPAYATQLYPGQQNYKSYQSPPQYSTVALPVVPSDPVAKLYVPQQQQQQQQSYGGSHSYQQAAPSGSYASLSAASNPISISSGNY